LVLIKYHKLLRVICLVYSHSKGGVNNRIQEVYLVLHSNSKGGVTNRIQEVYLVLHSNSKGWCSNRIQVVYLIITIIIKGCSNRVYLIITIIIKCHSNKTQCSNKITANKILIIKTLMLSSHLHLKEKNLYKIKSNFETENVKNKWKNKRNQKEWVNNKDLKYHVILKRVLGLVPMKVMV